MAYIKEIRDLVGHRPLIMTSASGALLDQQGAVLLQERADTGDWGFPGGYMEFGESFEQTVKREFKEDAGIEIVEVRLNQIAYAPEIAAAMLQRQQAIAVIAARKKIVEGAVSMVEMALDKLKEDNVVDLDEERKAQMVSNLLVVLCSSKEANPILNAGSIY